MAKECFYNEGEGAHENKLKSPGSRACDSTPGIEF